MTASVKPKINPVTLYEPKLAPLQVTPVRKVTKTPRSWKGLYCATNKNSASLSP